VLKPVNEIRIIKKLKYEASAIILLVGITYSMRGLLSDLNNRSCLTRTLAICVRYGKWC